MSWRVPLFLWFFFTSVLIDNAGTHSKQKNRGKAMLIF